MEEKTIIHIPAMPLAMMFGTIGTVIGLIGGLIAAGFWAAIASLATSVPGYQGPSPGIFQIFFGIGSIVLYPIMGFVTGLIQGLLYAVLYNFLAPRIGGIRLHFQ
jgi:hypothetical protein